MIMNGKNPMSNNQFLLKKKKQSKAKRKHTQKEKTRGQLKKDVLKRLNDLKQQYETISLLFIVVYVLFVHSFSRQNLRKWGFNMSEKRRLHTSLG